MEALWTADGAAALAAAQPWVGRDALAAVTALRAAGVAAELASAAVSQVALRAQAVAKFGDDAARLFFTREGLEQATRAIVAQRRARRLADAGVRRIADLGCGIGADALAFARAGLSVRAVDADASTAATAAANAAALGLADRITVAHQDATTVDLSDVDAVFCDPARRTRTARVFDPAAYSPPWSFVAALSSRVPATVLKLAPGIDHALLPAGAEAEWVSVDGDVVETAVWAGPLAAVPRRATAIRGGRTYELTGTGEEAAGVGPMRRYVYEPDGAVVRSHLVAEFAATVDGVLADPNIAYVFTDTAPTADTGLGRCFEITEELPFAVRRLRPALRERGIGRLEILKRGPNVDPNQLRRELKLAGPHGASLILLRAGEHHHALLAQPVPVRVVPVTAPPG